MAVAIVLLNLYVAVSIGTGFLFLFCQCTFGVLQLPFARKKIQQFLISRLFVIGHSVNDIIEIIPWGYIMCLTGGQQGTDDRHIDRCLMVAAEEVMTHLYTGLRPCTL